MLDIGGLEDIISSLRECVITPLLHPDLFRSSPALLTTPKGVLLYGPPGCGKTMLAKALAKESGATFINIAASSLMDKWFGESNKLVAGLFSLARKTQPSIIFIDEIDSFLRGRSKNDHEIIGMMKAEFMMCALCSVLAVTQISHAPEAYGTASSRAQTGYLYWARRTEFATLIRRFLDECRSSIPFIYQTPRSERGF